MNRWQSEKACSTSDCRDFLIYPTARPMPSQISFRALTSFRRQTAKAKAEISRKLVTLFYLGADSRDRASKFNLTPESRLESSGLYYSRLTRRHSDRRASFYWMYFKHNCAAFHSAGDKSRANLRGAARTGECDTAKAARPRRSSHPGSLSARLALQLRHARHRDGELGALT